MFWLQHSLTETQYVLVNEITDAHNASVFRANASSNAIINAAKASGDYGSSIASAILTMGGLHAPIIETMELLSLSLPAARANFMITKGQRVPGWGNSFIKDGHDPIWNNVRESLKNFKAISEKIDEVTDALHTAGKKIYPNPSAYTAATAIAIGCPLEVAPYLFIQFRLASWSKLYYDNR